VTFGASGNCTVAGSSVHLTGPGSCTITADQGGDANNNPAAQVSQSFSIISPPTVVSLVRAVPNPTMADSVTYTLTFSEEVSGVTSGNFAVTTGGALTGATVGAISGSGTTWTVTVNTGRGTGSLHLDVVNGTGITTGSGVTLGADCRSPERHYQIDKGGTGARHGRRSAGGQLRHRRLRAFRRCPRMRPRRDAFACARTARSSRPVRTGCAALVPSDPQSPYYCTLQLARYLASGAPDASLERTGRVVTAVTSITQEVNFSINGDGTLLVRGIRYNGTDNVPYVAKFTSTGAPDLSFGTSGIVMLNSLPIGLASSGRSSTLSGRILIVSTTPDTGVGEREDIFVTR